MNGAPDFLLETMAIPGFETFKPWVGQRRAEVIAWGSLSVMGVFLGFLALRGESLPCMGLGLFALLLVGALLVSFSHWIDRHTWIHADVEQIVYSSPLRKVSMGWERVESLMAVDAASGWRILVAGDDEFFQFRTESVMGPGTRAAMTVGVKGGKRLAALVCSKAELGPPMFERGHWICRRNRKAQGGGGRTKGG